MDWIPNILSKLNVLDRIVINQNNIFKCTIKNKYITGANMKILGYVYADKIKTYIIFSFVDLPDFKIMFINFYKDDLKLSNNHCMWIEEIPIEFQKKFVNKTKKLNFINF